MRNQIQTKDLDRRSVPVAASAGQAPVDGTDGVVTMHCRVVLRDVRTGAVMRLILEYPEECELFGYALSVQTALGTAVLGARVGSVVEWKTAGRVRHLEIIQIVPQPCVAGCSDALATRKDVMLKQRASSVAPSLVITDADYDRLTHLIHSPRYRQTHPSMLASLQEELDRGTVVSATGVPKGIVTMHSKVQVSGLDDDDEVETYTLVYPDEADIDQGKLSVLAPIGTALLGARVGQVVRFAVPAGVRRLRVVKILYQPEAAGDLHL